MSATNIQRDLENLIRRDLPSLSASQAEELADIMVQLIDLLKPLSIYVFGSRARNDASLDSDVDVLIVVAHDTQPVHHRIRRVREQLTRQYQFPLDVLVLTNAEFQEAARTPATLPATVLREGRRIYAAWRDTRSTAPAGDC